eukprot:10416134-Alexandrium_andersonii.AAC.1
MTTAGSWPLSRTTCQPRSFGSRVTVSRTAHRSRSSRSRKCAAAATVCAGSTPRSPRGPHCARRAAAE